MEEFITQQKTQTYNLEKYFLEKYIFNTFYFFQKNIYFRKIIQYRQNVVNP